MMLQWMFGACLREVKLLSDPAVKTYPECCLEPRHYTVFTVTRDQSQFLVRFKLNLRLGTTVKCPIISI